MLYESSLISDELYAFEQGYRLNIKYGDDLIQARPGILKSRAIAQCYNTNERENDYWQRAEAELQANSRNQKAFLAGKKARLKDKPDVFLLEQRQTEYIEEKTKAEEQNKGKKIDGLIKLIFGSQRDIDDIKNKIKKIAKWAAYGGAMFFGGMGMAVYGIGAHLRGSLEGLQAPFYSYATMMLTGAAAVGVEKLNDVIMNHKIYTRRETDKRREQLAKESQDYEALPLRPKFMAEVRRSDPNRVGVVGQLQRREPTVRVTIESETAKQRARIIEELAMLNVKIKNGEITEWDARMIKTKLEENLRKLDNDEKRQVGNRGENGRNNSNSWRNNPIR